MTDRHAAINHKTKVVLKNLSIQDFKNFGIQQIAYIRAVQNGSEINYSVHTADGKKIHMMDSLDEAIITTRQSNLEPVTVH